VTPNAPNEEIALLIKKLKYLKNPKIPRLENTLKYKKNFLFRGLSGFDSIPREA
jgi:hypothetical protein